MMKNLAKPRNYPVDASPFFKLSSKKKLALLLGVDIPSLNLNYSEIHTQYKVYVDKKSTRLIQESFGELLSLQRRLLKLLVRIETPSFLHSAIKRRSYKTNAEAHLDGENIFKIDIVKFYCAVKFERVYSFFLNILQCSIDIATILAKLCTVETLEHGVHLPTGSCISPILSFLACREMFDAINDQCTRASSVFSLYVDDITVSGKNATPALMFALSKIIVSSGFKYHKFESFKSRPAVVTGLIVNDGRLYLPHGRAKLIRSFEDTLNLTVDPGLKSKILAALIGRLSEAEHIDPIYRVKRKNIMARYQEEWKMITNDRILKSQIRSKKLANKSISKKSIDDIVLVPQL
jgi:RNA-directed DNA polymerase